ncbi:RNA polymerase subunit sigma-24 [Caulobacter sp. D5]|nr:RNA polymerase subunit sigma-24 [Caulobacter sp. D5]
MKWAARMGNCEAWGGSLVARRPSSLSRSSRWREYGVSGQSSLGQAAFGQFRSDDIDQVVRRHEGVLRRFIALRVGGGADVDDLVHEVFLRFARSPPDERVERLDSYLFQTAANLIRDRARRQQVRRLAVPEIEEAAASQAPATPEQTLIDRETLTEVRRALADLPERTRHVFLLYRIDGLRHQAIADALGVSISTVEKDVRRAMAHLTRRVRRP